MKRTILFSLILFALCYTAEAQQTRMWGEKRNKTGLHTQFNPCIAEGVKVTADLRFLNTELGPRFTKDQSSFLRAPFHKENWRPSVSAYYILPASYHVNWRFGGNLAYSSYGSGKKMDYHSVSTELFAGIEVYPFRKAGLYLLFGLAGNVSVTKTDSLYYNKEIRKNADGKPVYDPDTLMVKPISVSAVPMGVAGLGYSWKVSDRFMINVEASIHLSLLTTHEYNLVGVGPNRTHRERVLLGYNLDTKEFHSPEGYGSISLGLTYTLPTMRTTSKKAKFY